jgi:hypothetical protein
MTSDIGTVNPLPWMEEHCSPVGGAFEVKHRTTYLPNELSNIVTTYAPPEPQKPATILLTENQFDSDKMDKKSRRKKELCSLKNWNACLALRMRKRGLRQWCREAVHGDVDVVGEVRQGIVEDISTTVRPGEGAGGEVESDGRSFYLFDFEKCYVDFSFSILLFMYPREKIVVQFKVMSISLDLGAIQGWDQYTRPTEFVNMHHGIPCIID